MSIFTVTVHDDHVIFVGFDRAAADAVAHEANEEVQCEIAEVDELPLIDNYGFACARKEAGFLFPWLAKVSDKCSAWYAPKSWAAYCNMMSRDG
jgi:hypothetical protein